MKTIIITNARKQIAKLTDTVRETGDVFASIRLRIHYKNIK